jgi:uncharacterized protein YcbX
MRILARLSVTPVKGLALHHPAQVRITQAGLPENRRFYLVNEAGTLFSGSDFGPLVRIVPEYDPLDEHLRLVFPDGTIVEGDVSGLGGGEISNFFDRTVPGHRVEGPWADAFSSYIGKPVRMLRCDADGDGVDVLPLTVVSSASVRDLAAKGGYDGELDSRRFRINLELDGCEPYEEDSWDGGTIAIGEVTLALKGAIPRCVVTTQDPDTGMKDWNTLTQIAKFRPRIPDGLPFGMYAVVERPGEIRVGDAVQAP